MIRERRSTWHVLNRMIFLFFLEEDVMMSGETVKIGSAALLSLQRIKEASKWVVYYHITLQIMLLSYTTSEWIPCMANLSQTKTIFLAVTLTCGIFYRNMRFNEIALWWTIWFQKLYSSKKIVVAPTCNTDSIVCFQ